MWRCVQNVPVQRVQSAMAFDLGCVVDASPVLLQLDRLLLDVEKAIARQLQTSLLTAAIVEHLPAAIRETVI